MVGAHLRRRIPRLQRQTVCEPRVIGGDPLRKIARSGIVISLAAFLGLMGVSASDAKRGGHGHSDRYQGYHGPYRHGSYGWYGLPFFGFGAYGGECDELLRQAIAIDTPDPRYWNRYDACIGL